MNLLFFSFIFASFACCFGEDAFEDKTKISRVIGGYSVPIEEYPYMVQLTKKDTNHFCGASIISRSWVLTATHCVRNKITHSLFDPKDLRIRAGTSIRNSGGVVVKVRKICIHPIDDLAILQLSINLKFSSKIKSIRLANFHQGYTPGKLARIAGWGLTSSKNETIPTNLQSVEIPLWNIKKCQKIDPKITDRLICAGNPDGTKNVCFGDSGGPLVLEGIQIGLAQARLAKDCSTPHSPVIFVNVAAARNFITQITGI